MNNGPVHELFPIRRQTPRFMSVLSIESPLRARPEKSDPEPKEILDRDDVRKVWNPWPWSVVSKTAGAEHVSFLSVGSQSTPTSTGAECDIPVWPHRPEQSGQRSRSTNLDPSVKAKLKRSLRKRQRNFLNTGRMGITLQLLPLPSRSALT